MAIQTYRDPGTGKIFTQDGQHIADLSEYQSGVRTGKYSGNPLPIEQMPTTQRQNDGSVTSFNLGNFNNHQSLLQAAKEVIKIKQGQNQDIRTQQEFWRNKARDIAPFKDERLRELSPQDQASIRTSQYGAAQSHLQGLTEEKQYRETAMSDTIRALTDMISETGKLAKEDRDQVTQTLSDMQKKQDLNLPITDDDYKKIGLNTIDGKVGGSVAWRHNNPLNIKYGDFAKSYGAQKGQDATDGGGFAVFPDIETGLKAAKDLLQSKNYKDLSVDAAMKRWSNKGYGIDQLLATGLQQGLMRATPSWAGKNMKDLNPSEIDELMTLMRTQEGWKEGTILGQAQQDLIELTESQKSGLMQDAGLSNADVKGYNADDWIMLKQIVRESLLEDAQDNASKWREKVTIRGKEEKNPDAATVRNKLVEKYGGRLSSAEIDSVLETIGGKKESTAIFPEWSWK